MARAGIYDLLIVDVMLPHMSGYAIVRALRDDLDTTPILLLTARDAEDDRVEGLDSGADDYLIKPFGIKELLARIRALTRRAGDLKGVRMIHAGGYSLDLEERSVSLQGVSLTLTHTEFQLMELFIRNAGQVLKRDMLFDRVWGYDAEIDSNVLETYIHFLRKKLEKCRQQQVSGTQAADILTVRSVGYVFKEA